MTTEYRVLGPLEVVHDGVPVPLPSGRARVLLASLLLRANEVVPVDELVDRLWDGAPPTPARAKASLHMVVSRLRQSLGAADSVRTEVDGYRVEIDPDRLDLHRFRALVDAGRCAEALELWRGSPLSDVASDSLRRDEVPALLEERVEALERRVDADLESGSLTGLAAELRALTQRYPLRERFWAQLMTVLYRTSRQAEALAAYRDVSAVLADELGVDPGPELRDLQRLVLAGEPLAPAEVVTATVPRQLPPAVASFSGRAEDLAVLDGLLAGGSAPAVVISAIAGSGGVGKTALAVHWAHSVRDRFPDGQLFVNLRGYDLERPMTVQEALARLLRGLGVDPGSIPAETADQTNLFRSLTADRRMLVVLDNVSAPEQVRPLLPSTPTCLVVVTSRSDLRGLAVLDDAHVHRLGTLPPNEAYALLARVLGADRASAEPDAVARLAAACGHLPLALRIAAADLASQPRTAVADYVAALESADVLEVLAVPGDPDAAVLTAFRGSYAALDEETRLVFRRLGLVPGATFTDHAAAVLGELPLVRARRVVAHLVSVHLVERRDDGRFALHDLLRLYALDRAVEEDGADGCEGSRARLHDWYLRMVDDAATMLYSDVNRLSIRPVTLHLPEVVHDGNTGALAWLEAEKANLVAVIGHTAQHGPHQVAWQMASGLSWHFFETRDDALWALSLAGGKGAAEAAGDRRAWAAMTSAHGNLTYAQGDVGLAIKVTSEAEAVYREVGELDPWASTILNLGVYHQVTGDLERAADCFRRSLQAKTRLGSVSGRATAILNLGCVSLELGRYDEGAKQLSDALDLYRDLKSLGGQITAHVNLAEALVELGDLEGGLAQASCALDLSVESRARQRLPQALWLSAEALLELGRVEEARTLVEEALVGIREIASPKDESDCHRVLALVSLHLGDAPTAVDYAETALTMAVDCDYMRGEIQSQLIIARAFRSMGKDAEAVPHAERAVELAQDRNIRVELGEALTSLAEARLFEGAADEAVALASRGLAVHQETGQRLDESRSREVLARCEQVRR
ncbi:BTAD domain-containing putative transcriptional regulator [Umezawaea sp. NPDC059074]|uniref:AfsR/SARP family transcriptional regulator n=1 Tax=Umezawaea sp. NPDC059074 TaxID=3346716 RepID=UPI0036A66D40